MKILLFTLVWPEPTSSAAGTRTVALLDTLRSDSNELHVWSPCQQNSFQSALEGKGIHTRQMLPNDSSVDEALVSLMPDVVVFDRFMTEEMFGWRVKSSCPDAALVLDTIDLHFLRKIRQKKYETHRPLVSGDLNVAKDLLFEELLVDETFREVASIYRCDLTIVVSDFEYQLLCNTFQIQETRLLLLPIGAQKVVRAASFQEKEGFCSIGNCNHPPNSESVLLLKHALWPKIRAQLIRQTPIQNPSLHIYGAYPSSEILALHDPHTGFIVHGWVADAIEAIQKHRVSLAPLPYGAGIKGKILDSWSAGTPVVTTEIGAEGMRMDGHFGGRISDSIENFACDAVELYTDKSSYESALHHSDNILAGKFDPESICHKFTQAIPELLETVHQRRCSCFISNMLDFHQFRSTEYMSRWIEEKNKSTLKVEVKKV